MTREGLLRKTKPILFNTEMVRAILDDLKEYTRRIVKGFIPDDAIWGYTAFTQKGYISCRGTFSDGYGEKFFKLPCEKGNILYVRETWQYLYELDDNEQIIEGTGRYYYAATDTIPFDTYVDSMGVTHERVPWRPSIHMPKKAARIFLKVKEVRVERLQDITEEQAEREGVYICDGVYRGYTNAIEMFAELWNSTIMKSDIDRYGWVANPWVWVIEFERLKEMDSDPEKHEQRAEHLDKIKELRALVEELQCALKGIGFLIGKENGVAYKLGYNKAVEDFVRVFKNKSSMENGLIDEISKQLKMGLEVCKKK